MNGGAIDSRIPSIRLHDEHHREHKTTSEAAQRNRPIQLLICGLLDDAPLLSLIQFNSPDSHVVNFFILLSVFTIVFLYNSKF